MTDTHRHTAIMNLIASYTTEHTGSRKTARAALINEGIYTPKGELTPEFGGPDKKTKAKSRK